MKMWLGVDEKKLMAHQNLSVQRNSVFLGGMDASHLYPNRAKIFLPFKRERTFILFVLVLMGPQNISKYLSDVGFYRKDPENKPAAKFSPYIAYIQNWFSPVAENSA